MNTHAEAFDHWIRTSFVEMNTELEELYFGQDDRANVEGVGDPIKAALRDEGHRYVVDLLQEGNTGEGFESGFGVLGNVGLYMGALRRHELTNPDRDQRSPFPEASSLALHVGASIGMAPRFATAHLATHNLAIAGKRKSFTSLADEFLFIDENTRAILGFKRAADALARIVPLGVSNPVADAVPGGEGRASRRDPRQRPAFRDARRGTFLFQRSALLQALPRRAAGLSRRKCRRLLRDQRDRSPARPLPRQ
jgi:hypothetical protein